MQNTDAFVALIKEHQGLIYKVTKLYTNSKEDAEDLYQDIVYQLWKSLGTFRNESKISTWIYRIALNASITHLRKEKRKGSQLAVTEELLNKEDTKDNLQEEQFETMYAYLKKLNEVEKGIVFLYLEGKSYDEIAAITGFTASNVGTRLSRIKQKISADIKK